MLRPFFADDAESVASLAGNPAVAKTTLNVPHPYDRSMAEAWITTHEKQRKSGRNHVFATVDQSSDHLVGAVNLAVDKRNNKGEIGYWIGEKYWGFGYATEATIAVVGLGFETLGLNRIAGQCFARNPASGRVLEKAGMAFEGTARQSKLKEGRYEDFEIYAILRSDWETR